MSGPAGGGCACDTALPAHPPRLPPAPSQATGHASNFEGTNCFRYNHDRSRITHIDGALCCACCAMLIWTGLLSLLGCAALDQLAEPAALG